MVGIRKSTDFTIVSMNTFYCVLKWVTLVNPSTKLRASGFGSFAWFDRLLIKEDKKSWICTTSSWFSKSVIVSQELSFPISSLKWWILILCTCYQLSTILSSWDVSTNILNNINISSSLWRNTLFSTLVLKIFLISLGKLILIENMYD